MDIRTHHGINQALCGEPLEVGDGRSRVRLVCGENMAADASGLIHGGFLFGLADYAAMLAVNHPNVVLGAAETRFLKPSRIGDELIATAREEAPDGKKRKVHVDVHCGDECVFTGMFTCFVPSRHVLDGK